MHNRASFQIALLSRATAEAQIRDLQCSSSAAVLRTSSTQHFQPLPALAKPVEFLATPSRYTLNPRKCTFQMKVYLASFPLSDDPLPLSRPSTKEPFYPCYYYHLRPSKLTLTTAHL